MPMPQKTDRNIWKSITKSSLKYNDKLKILLYLQDLINYVLVPLGLLILFFRRKQLLRSTELLLFYNIVLSCWGISNLMLNISQGERFVILFSFIAVGLFFNVYLTTRKEFLTRYFNLFIVIFVPVIFVYALMALIASHFIISTEFFVSNLIVEIITK